MTAPENNELRDRATGDLLKELSDQTTTLVRQEIELAKAEFGQKGKMAGRGAGLFGGASLFALGAFAALTTCIIAAVDSAMPLSLAALIRQAGSSTWPERPGRRCDASAGRSHARAAPHHASAAASLRCARSGRHANWRRTRLWRRGRGARPRQGPAAGRGDS